MDSSNITHKRILAISIPIILSNVTIPLLGVVDTAVIGQLGKVAPIGAVGIGALIISAIYWIFGFLRMGTTGLTAQAVGKKDNQEIIALLSRTLLIGITAGLVLILINDFIFWGSFKVSPASEEVENLAYSYMKIRIYSAPAAISIFGILGWLIAQERTRMVLLLQLWMNGSNILLDFLFVIGFNWGVEGVALATVFAEVSSFFLGIFICRSAFIGSAWRSFHLVLNKAKISKMAVVNFDILIRSMFLQAAFILFMFLSSDINDEILAINQILLQFLSISAYALDGFAFSAEALIGQAFGAKSVKSLRKVSIFATFWAFLAAIVLTLCFYFGSDFLIVLMTSSEELRENAQVYVYWVIVAPILAAPAFILDGIFIGATRTKDMRNCMIISFGIYCLVVWLLYEPFGNQGLWAALMVMFIVRAVTLFFQYFSIERSIKS
ncbi:MAG: MATE family efflux transporter [Rhodobacteraceae bacterium]|nr:MATE family efflux transporter [Paracoccaceae bacterium]MDC0161977.1 MATE family efflux transporter [Paracoccaceae bacterium]|tara:strand:- start:12 stop:1325 length:1314 start_codon:yes stop_codon:yes gene_type:complete